MEVCVLKLKCLTNMQMGGGDVNYNVVDIEVEKDPVTGYPTMNASGVKGALREYFSRRSPEELGQDTPEQVQKVVDRLFGSGSDKKGGAGALKIMSGDLLARAMRASSGAEPFYLVSTREALRLVENKVFAFTGKHLPWEKAVSGETSPMAEGFSLKEPRTLSKETVYLMEEREFSAVSLPCFARNYLENGVSKNLWYEEVVPHQSVFVLVVASEDKDALTFFRNSVEGKVIQFGGNASVGCGYCKVTQIPLGGSL